MWFHKTTNTTFMRLKNAIYSQHSRPNADSLTDMKFFTNCLSAFVIVLCSSFGGQAQSRVEYLDPQFNLVSDSLSSKFVRTIKTVNDSVFEVQVIFRTGEFMMFGTYSDKNLTVENGEFKYFYANGTLESEGKFRNGLKVGTWKRWNYDGRPKPDRFYPDENFKRSNRTTAAAKFPGGTAALQQLVADSLNYPQEAKDRKIEGTVYITFVIDAQGDVRQAEVSEGVHYLLDEEALRFVSKLPTWTPATRNGMPVDSSFIMPISFDFKAFQNDIPVKSQGDTAPPSGKS